jgi:hypothetical protein
MHSTKARKTRAVAVPGTHIGKERYQLYREAYSRINEARAQGFYLEAITIVESLVSDRLESRLSYLLNNDFSFKTLGDLIARSRAEETDGELRTLVGQDLDAWRVRRNKALHELAKIADGDTAAWETRTAEFAKTARDGLETLRKIDKRVKQLRKKEL